MKKLIAILVMSLLVMPMIPVNAVEVAEDCWMEQKMRRCAHWHHHHCHRWVYYWEQRDCDVEPEWYQGEDDWCRVQCDYIEIDEFNEEDYYTKEEIDEMFDGMYSYLRCKYVKKWVVKLLFWKVWKLKQRVSDVEDYIAENEGTWSQDKWGAGGFSMDYFVWRITEAFTFLDGDKVGPHDQAFVEIITKYLVSWKDFAEYIRRIVYLERKVTVMQDFLYEKFGKEYCDYEAFRMIEEFGYESVECGGETYISVNGGVMTISPL